MIWYLARTRFLGLTALMQVWISVSMLVTVGGISPALGVVGLLLPRFGSQSHLAPFDAALPVSGRDLKMARMLGSALPLLIAVFIALMCVPWLPRSSNVNRLQGLLNALAAIPLIVMLPQLRVSVSTSAATNWREPVLIGVAIGLYAFLLWKAPPGIAIIALACCTLLVAVRVMQTIAASVELVPISVSRTAQISRVALGNRSMESSGLAWWAFAATQLMSTQVFMGWGFALLFGALHNATYFAAVITMMLTMSVRSRLRWMESLPVAKHVRLLCLAIPIAVLPTLLIGIGEATGVPGVNSRQYLGTDAPFTPYTDRYFSSETRVPLAFWELAPSGIVPRITSPSGESCAAYTLSVGPLVLYNPYSSRESSSKRFVEWQFMRATEAVFGNSMTQDEFRKASRARALPARLTESLPIRLLCGSAFLTLLLFQLLMDHAAGTSRFSRRAAIAGGLRMLPVLLILGFELAYFKQGIHPVGALTELLMLNLAAKLPDNLAVVAVVAIIPVAAMYALLSWQFARAETLERIVPVRI